MKKRILTKNQEVLLDAVGKEPNLTRMFYLTGGTARGNNKFIFARSSEALT